MNILWICLSCQKDETMQHQAKIFQNVDWKQKQQHQIFNLEKSDPVASDSCFWMMVYMKAHRV